MSLQYIWVTLIILILYSEFSKSVSIDNNKNINQLFFFNNRNGVGNGVELMSY